MKRSDWTEHLLVTGGAGFIGAHLVRKLLSRGRRVTVLDDLSSGDRNSLPNHPDLRFLEGSVLDENAVQAASVGTSGLVHLAGVVGMRLATEQAGHAYQVATEGSQIVLSATGLCPAVLFSSSAVYGHTADEAISENELIPRSVVEAYDGGKLGYALGKWEMERLGREAADSGRKVLAIRPFNVVGDGQSHSYGMVLPNFARAALLGKPLEVHDQGEQSRTFCEVKTFVDAVLDLLAHKNAFGAGFRAVNVGSSLTASIRSLAELVLERSQSNSEIQFIPYESVFPGRSDVQRRVPDTTTLRELIGPMDWPRLPSIVDDALHDQRRRLANEDSSSEV